MIYLVHENEIETYTEYSIDGQGIEEVIRLKIYPDTELITCEDCLYFDYNMCMKTCKKVAKEDYCSKAKHVHTRN